LKVRLTKKWMGGGAPENAEAAAALRMHAAAARGCRSRSNKQAIGMSTFPAL